jgi:hypothetical protein
MTVLIAWHGKLISVTQTKPKQNGFSAQCANCGFTKLTPIPQTMTVISSKSYDESFISFQLLIIVQYS